MQLYSEWDVVPAPDPAAVETIADALDVSPVTASLLAARGYATPEAARAFLQADLSNLHDGSLLPDMDRAVARLVRALDDNELIGIYGDYDVDGQTGTALLVRGLRALGAEPVWYIPERVAEGYGLHRQAIEGLAADGVTLLVTVDCGSGAADEIARAKELGMDVIVTDHHEPGSVPLDAEAFVNPKRADSRYPFRELAGVGVAWKLMQALWRTRGQRGRSPFGLELTALGTVADVCPLVDENRSFVKEGLRRINEGTMPALTALAEVSGARPGEVTAGRVAFGLAPRLNAAGRVGHAALGVKLLLCDDAQEAARLAAQLDEENRRRRDLEARILDEALASVEEGALLSDWVLVVAGEGWHPGVIGIVASRLVERYARPAVVIGWDGDVGTGSGRSIDAFDLHGALQACEDVLQRYGGHQMAAGLTVRRDDLSRLRQAINEYAAQVLTPADLVPKTRVDARVPLDEVTPALARELERLAPFGAGNPTPVFGAEDVLVVGTRTVGSDGSHLKLTIKDPKGEAIHEAMAFGGGALADAVPPGSEVDVAFDVRLGQWRGEPQLTLVLRACQSPLALAERKAALDGAPDAVDAPPLRTLRGRPVPVADRRQRAAMHPLARAAYLAPLADTGARVVVVIGPDDDGRALARSIEHSLQRPVHVAGASEDGASSRLILVPADAPPAAPASDRPEAGNGDIGAAEVHPWPGRGHLVVFGLPVFEPTWWALLLGAAASPGWTVHLAYDEAGVEAAAEALARRYPDADTLRVLYRAMRATVGNRLGPLPPVERLAAYVESERLGLLSPEGVARGLAVFEQLGLVQPGPGGLYIVPQKGRRVDVNSSEIYNDGVRIQQKFAAYSRIALEASPAALLALAAERSPLDGFAFPHPGSAGFSQAGSQL